MTECEKLKMGFWYNANNDTELLEQREDAEELCYFLNQTSPKRSKKREEFMSTLLPNRGKDTTIFSPFYTDYGCFGSCHRLPQFSGYCFNNRGSRRL